MINIKFENKYKCLAVVGSPIDHTLSPCIQNFMINELNIPYYYLPFNIAKENFNNFLDAAILLNIVGFNITMPNKIEAYENCNQVFGDAIIAKSVNTMKNRNSNWEGYSTDGDGFNISLKENGFSFNDKKVLLIGSGGAAKSIAISAIKNSAKEINVICRKKEQGEQITNNIKNAFVHDYSHYNLIKLSCENEIIINCTPLGMSGVKSEFENYDFLNTNSKIVCDLIYKPNETNLIKLAKEKKHFIINGLSMLIYQAILSLEIFADIQIDKKLMKKDVEKYLIKNKFI